MTACPATSPNSAVSSGPAEVSGPAGATPEKISSSEFAAQPKALPGGIEAPPADPEDGTIFKTFGAERYLVGTYDEEYQCRGFGESAAAVVVAIHIDGKVMAKSIQSGEFVPGDQTLCPENAIRIVIGEGETAWYQDTLMGEEKNVSFQVAASDISRIHPYLKLGSPADFLFSPGSKKACLNLSCVDLDMRSLTLQLEAVPSRRITCSP
jgi:hypothetical protein